MLWASASAVSGSECAGTLTTTQDTQASQAWDCRMPRSPTKVKRLFQSHGINSLTSSRGLRGDKDRVLPLRCNDAAEGDLREVSHNIRISSHEWHGELRIVTDFFPVSSIFFWICWSSSRNEVIFYLSMKSNLSQGEARIPRDLPKVGSTFGGSEGDLAFGDILHSYPATGETEHGNLCRSATQCNPTETHQTHETYQTYQNRLKLILANPWNAASGWSPFPNNVDESKKYQRTIEVRWRTEKKTLHPPNLTTSQKHRSARTSQSWAMCSEPHLHRLNKHTAFGNWSSWKLLDNLATEWYNPKNIQHKQCTFSSGLCRNTSLRLRQTKQTKQNMKETVRLHCQGSWTCWRCTLLILGYLWILWILSNKSSTFRNTSKMLTVSPWALRLGPWDLSISPHP